MNTRYSPLFILCAIWMVGNNLHAQNCTVNAGIGQTVCFLNDATLNGNIAGAYDNTQISWSLVSGPTVSLINPNQLQAQVSNLRTQATYVFQLSAVCADGYIAYDTITINVNGPLTVPLAGPDIQICDSSNAASITFDLSANSPIGSEIGSWSVSGAPVGVFIPNANAPNAQYRISNPRCISNGEFIFRWSLTAGGCSSSDEMMVRYNRSAQISAGADTVISCGETLELKGSCPGGLPGQGTWTVIQAPNIPVLSDVNAPNATLSNLVSGNYILRWTVQANCSNGYDEMLISVTNTTNIEVSITGNRLIDCSNRFELRGTPFSAPQQGRWRILSHPGSGTLTSVNSSSTSIIQAIPGVYLIEYQITGPCFTGSDTIQVQVRSIVPVSIADAGVDQRFCNTALPSVINLQANSPAATETGFWTQLGGTRLLTFSNINNPQASITNFGNFGTFTLKWTISKTGCISEDIVLITISRPISFIGAGPDQTLACGASTVNLSHSGGGGLWEVVSQPPGANAIHIPNTNVVQNLNVNGTYTFRCTFSNFCNSISDEVNVVISLGGQAGLSNAGSDQSLACNIVSCSLAGNQPSRGVGSWFQVSGPSRITFSDSSSTTPNVAGLVSGDYIFRWIITDGFRCPTQEDDVLVRVSTGLPPTPSAGNNVTVCSGASIQLDGSQPSQAAVGFWTQVAGPSINISNPNQPDATISGFSANSIYRFRWTMTNGCGSSYNEVEITTTSEQAPSVAMAGPDQCIAIGTTSFALTGNTPNSGVGTWYFVSGPSTPSLSNPSQANTSVSVTSNGTYVFRWSISAHPTCAASDDIVSVTIDNPITFTNAGADQFLCNLPYSNVYANSFGNSIGVWTQTSGPPGVSITNPTSAYTGITGLVNNYVYTFRWTVNNGGCPSVFDELNIISNEMPSIAYAGADVQRCDTSTFTLNALSPTSGQGIWNIVSGTQCVRIINPTSNNASVTIVGTGRAVLRWMVSTPSCQPYTDEVVINVDYASVRDSIIYLCNSNSALLLANSLSNGNGRWEQVSGPTANILQPNTAATNVLLTGGIGDYEFRWTVSTLGCSSSAATVLVRNTNGITMPNAGIDQIICPTSGTTSVQLTGNVPLIGNGLWTRINGPGAVTITSSGSPSTSVIGLEPGTHRFRYTIINGGCREFDDVDIDIFRITPPTAGPDRLLCAGSQLSLAGNQPSSGIGTWTQVSGPVGAVFSAPNFGQTQVSNLQPGRYLLRWTIENGTCRLTDDVNVNVGTIPTPSISPSTTTFCAGASVILIANGMPAQAGTYQWDGPAGFAGVSQTESISNLQGNNSGTYRLTLTDAVGCSAVTSKNLQVSVPQVQAFNSGPYCQGATMSITGQVGAGQVFAWQGAGVGNATPLSFTLASTQAGSQNFTLSTTDANGCTASSTTTVLVYSTDVNISNSGPVCGVGNPITLSATSLEPATFTWSDGTQSINGANIVVNPNGGNTTYQLVANFSSGCTYTAFTTAVVYSTDVNISNSGPVCGVGNPITLSATSLEPATFTWSDGIQSINGANIVVNPNEGNTTYQLVANFSSGCTYTAFTTAVVHSTDVNISNSGPVCGVGNPITLSATSLEPATFTWSDGTQSINGADVVVNPNEGSTTYQLVANFSSGCTYTAFTTAVVHSTDVNISNSGPVCGVGNPITLSATSLEPATFTWRSGTQILLGANVAVTPAAGITNYQLIATFGSGCTSSEQTNVTVNQIPTISSVPIFENRCVGSSFSLTPSYSSDVTTVTWTTPTGVLLSQNDLQFPAVAISNQGRYTVTFGNAAGCSDSASFVLGVSEQPIVSLPSSIEVCEGASATVIPTVSISRSTFYWPNGTNDREVLLSAGYYVMTATYGGCSDTASITITERNCVSQVCEFSFPNVFTPNADGLNDSFGIITPCNYDKYRMEIYNRWGQLIYKTFDQRSTWDGNYQNEPAPADTYVYLVYFGDVDKEALQAQGDVSLLR